MSSKLTPAQAAAVVRLRRPEVAQRRIAGQKASSQFLSASKKNFSAAREACPFMQPDENHVNAHSWTLRSPAGATYRFRNLAHFVRQHAGLFDNTVRAINGLQRLAPDTKNHRNSWFGWTLLTITKYEARLG